jgi:hypothetical protein
MAQEPHSGLEGKVVAGGVDWNVHSWDGSESDVEQEYTNTSHFDPTEKIAYEAWHSVKRRFEGTFNFTYDSNNEPMPTLRAGNKVPATFTKTSGKTFNFPLIKIKELRITNGDRDGLFMVTVSFRNDGKYTFT